MDIEETRKLLALASARDGREPSRGAILAWHEDLQDLDFDLAREALGRHFRTSTDYLMPVHVIRNAREIRDERAREEHSEALEMPSRFELDELRDERLKRGVAACVAAITKKTADPDEGLSEIHARALARARAERTTPPPQFVRRNEPKLPMKDGPHADPATSDIAALATAYLIDGYHPKDVSERLGVSRSWCERIARRFISKEE